MLTSVLWCGLGLQGPPGGCLRGELFEGCAKDAVEGRERMDHVGERVQRGAQLDREHELSHDLACTGRDHCRPAQYPARAIGDQLDRAPMKVVDVAPRGFGWILPCDDHVDAAC